MTLNELLEAGDAMPFEMNGIGFEKVPRDWDMIVIGGGITGAGIFEDAAASGLKVLLLEKNDYAWATSSRSSKLVHGGFRYLRHGQIYPSCEPR